MFKISDIRLGSIDKHLEPSTLCFYMDSLFVKCFKIRNNFVLKQIDSFFTFGNLLILDPIEINGFVFKRKERSLCCSEHIFESKFKILNNLEDYDTNYISVEILDKILLRKLNEL